ncbi:MAG: FHA domain-containing protein, partial [Planctomycetota bacterium]
MENEKKRGNVGAFAYLVIRDGAKWSDVFRLIPGRTVTIGRAPTNQIVIREEQASRQHAELFQTEQGWTIRDLSSRNGTAVGEDRVVGDRALKPGDVIWIAKTQLVFVNDLSSAYDKKLVPRGPETSPGLELDDEQPTITSLATEPTTITHRRQKTKFLQAEEVELGEQIPEEVFAETRLCRLAEEVANETKLLWICRLAR